MFIKDIQRFSDARYKARAYLCYLFSRNLPNKLPGVSLDGIKAGLDKIAHEIESFDAFYVLDSNGIQIEDSMSLNKEYCAGKGENRSNKAYYYRAVREKRCILSDPYPSTLTNELCVTASTPIYDEKNELKFVVCVDISLDNVLELIAPGVAEGYFGKFLKCIYSAFAVALFMVSAFLFIYGVSRFLSNSLMNINVEEMFETTIVLTLALAIFDLVKAIFEEEVLGKSNQNDDTDHNKTMVRFIGSIIIALAIEALMLVFKFAITAPDHIINAIYLIAGVAMLMVALSIYLISVKNKASK
ncbi:PDC sensor domain-containing protein [Campylobacter sp. RM16192]|uniref:PDC sensor domain-containing protein n=1 Tax=Campylobacter sp. RM16192 TaxID=1660080 RepID=UPI00145297A9|nr:PDC sensor domain-containing protein [Campylobacter sp. RM16192]QCD52092.1 putative membrane protein [Campylobacter sp. RM16192]